MGTVLVLCRLCNVQFEQINYAHLWYKHSTSIGQYKELFPGAELCSERIAKLKTHYGENNPNYGKDFTGANNPNYGNHPIAWNKGLTKETDARIANYGRTVSASRKGKYTGVFNSFYGKKHTEETRKKMSDNWGERIIWSKGHTKATDVRLVKLGASVSIARKGKYRGAENPLYGKHHTEERKRLQSEQHKRLWQDPQYRQAMLSKMSESMKRRWTHPDNRAKMLEMVRKGFYTLEARRHRSESRRGERNPSWAGGKSFEPYTKDFNDELKSLIRMRDVYTCQLCGIPECEMGELLAIHHIDYNKQVSLPSNLISLCRSCNAKVNKEREHWEEYFKEVLNERQLNPKALRTPRKWEGKKVKIEGGGIFVHG